MFNNLSDLLRSQTKKRGLSLQVEASMLLELFMQVAAEHFSKETLLSVKPISVSEKVLAVAVLSPALAQELKMRESVIIKQINEKIGHDAIQSLRFLS